MAANRINIAHGVRETMQPKAGSQKNPALAHHHQRRKGVTSAVFAMRAASAASGPYDMHRKRLGAFFVASLATPVSPFVVGETIAAIADGRSSHLRHPSGPDAEALIRHRTSRSDEEWVNLGALSDAEFVSEMKSKLGLDVKL
jgi:hypothetical protein